MAFTIRKRLNDSKKINSLLVVVDCGLLQQVLVIFEFTFSILVLFATCKIARAPIARSKIRNTVRGVVFGFITVMVLFTESDYEDNRKMLQRLADIFNDLPIHTTLTSSNKSGLHQNFNRLFLNSTFTAI